MEYALLGLSLLTILAGAHLFTNSVEFLGHRLRLSQGAVGSLLAAVGTALPESLVPLVAMLRSDGSGRAGSALAPGTPAGGFGHLPVFGTADPAALAPAHEIAIGAILGAPLMLTTLAMCLAGVAILYYGARGARAAVARVEPSAFHRDLTTFFSAYTLALGAAFMAGRPPRLLVAGGLVVLYIWYVWETVTREPPLTEAEHLPEPLVFGGSRAHLLQAAFQGALALALIMVGARYFVAGVARAAGAAGIPPFLFSAVVAPVATELPEKFNSIIWIRKGRDTLAFGNITGALVFQSTVIPALGIALSPWGLAPAQVVTAGLAVASALVIYLGWRVQGRLSPYLLLSGGAFYACFCAYVAWHGSVPAP